MVSCSADTTIKLWDTNTGIVLKTLTDHSAAPFALILLNDGNFASSGFDYKIILWNKISYTPLKVLYGHTDAIYCLTTLKNGFIVSVQRTQL